MVVCVVERRRRLQVQRREHLHALTPGDELGVLGLATLALNDVAGKQNDYGMEVWIGEATDPVGGMIFSAVTEHLRAGDHALLELFRERCERCLVHTQSTQALPGEGHRHPAIA